METNQNNDKLNQVNTGNASNQKTNQDFNKKETDPNNPVPNKENQNGTDNGYHKQSDSITNKDNSITNHDKSQSGFKNENQFDEDDDMQDEDDNLNHKTDLNKKNDLNTNQNENKLETQNNKM